MDNHLFRTRASNFSIASLITSDYCDDENQFSPSATSLLSNHSHFFTDKSIDNYLLDEQHRLSSLLPPLTDNNTSSEQYPYELTTKETLPHFNMEGKNLFTQPPIIETFERFFLSLFRLHSISNGKDQINDRIESIRQRSSEQWHVRHAQSPAPEVVEHQNGHRIEESLERIR